MQNQRTTCDDTERERVGLSMPKRQTWSVKERPTASKETDKERLGASKRYTTPKKDIHFQK